MSAYCVRAYYTLGKPQIKNAPDEFFVEITETIICPALIYNLIRFRKLWNSSRIKVYYMKKKKVLLDFSSRNTSERPINRMHIWWRNFWSQFFNFDFCKYIFTEVNFMPSRYIFRKYTPQRKNFALAVIKFISKLLNMKVCASNVPLQFSHICVMNCMCVCIPQVLLRIFWFI